VALNKAKTSLGMKIVLIFLIIAFVTSFISLSGMFTTPPGTTTAPTGQVDQISARYAPTVEMLEATVRSEPTSYTALVNLGNVYTEWGGEIVRGTDPATATTSSLPIWRAASDVFARALEIEQGDAPVEGNYALALYNLGQVEDAVAMGEQAVASDPEMVPGWLNLGNYYAAAGRTDDARAAWERVIEITGAGSPQAQQASELIAQLQ
jgi:tetratricopeptide (TPR) repeat protein